MYGSRQMFEGRITGFTMGTGSTLALLPPENATGNFVKIVQRLPVRIELTNYDPGQGAAVLRPVGDALRLLQGAGNGTERGQVPAAGSRPVPSKKGRFRHSRPFEQWRQRQAREESVIHRQAARATPKRRS